MHSHTHTRLSTNALCRLIIILELKEQSVVVKFLSYVHVVFENGHERGKARNQKTHADVKTILKHFHPRGFCVSFSLKN